MFILLKMLYILIRKIYKFMFKSALSSMFSKKEHLHIHFDSTLYLIATPVVFFICIIQTCSKGCHATNSAMAFPLNFFIPFNAI